MDQEHDLRAKLPRLETELLPLIDRTNEPFLINEALQAIRSRPRTIHLGDEVRSVDEVGVTGYYLGHGQEQRIQIREDLVTFEGRSYIVVWIEPYSASVEHVATDLGIVSVRPGQLVPVSAARTALFENLLNRFPEANRVLISIVNPGQIEQPLSLVFPRQAPHGYELKTGQFLALLTDIALAGNADKPLNLTTAWKYSQERFRGDHDPARGEFSSEPPVACASQSARTVIIGSGTSLAEFNRRLAARTSEPNSEDRAVLDRVADQPTELRTNITHAGCFWANFFGTPNYLQDPVSIPQELVSTGELRNHNCYGGETLSGPWLNEHLAHICNNWGVGFHAISRQSR